MDNEVNSELSRLRSETGAEIDRLRAELRAKPRSQPAPEPPPGPWVTCACGHFIPPGATHFHAERPTLLSAEDVRNLVSRLRS